MPWYGIDTKNKYRTLPNGQVVLRAPKERGKKLRKQIKREMVKARRLAEQQVNEQETPT